MSAKTTYAVSWTCDRCDATSEVVQSPEEHRRPEDWSGCQIRFSDEAGGDGFGGDLCRACVLSLYDWFERAVG